MSPHALTRIFSRDAMRYLCQHITEPFEPALVDREALDVDADGFLLESSPWRIWLERIFRSWAWEVSVWVLAVLNAIVVAVNVNYHNLNYYDHLEVRPRRFMIQPFVYALDSAQQAYLVWFWVEMGLQLGIFGSRFFVDMFAVTDLVILFLSVVPYGVSGALYGFDSFACNAWRSFTIARILRVLRIVHVVRFDSLFREFWILVRGITYSLRVLLWGLGLGFIIVLIFAIPLTAYLGGNPYFSGRYSDWNDNAHGLDVADYNAAHFGSVGRTARSLFQVMTLDSWVELVDPLVSKSSGLWWVFLAFVAISCFAFLNLLTAVIVESAINYNKDEQDRLELETNNRRKRLQAGLERLTKKRVLTKLEIIDILNNECVFRDLLKAFGCTSPDDVHAICDILTDPDDLDAQLSIRSFLLGVQRFRPGPAKSKDLLEALSRLSILEHLTRQQAEQLKRLEATVQRVVTTLDTHFARLMERLDADDSISSL